MLDIRLIREEPEKVVHNLKRRGQPEKEKTVNELLRVDSEYRKLLQELETLRHRRNLKSEELGKRKNEGERLDSYRNELRALNQKIKSEEEKVSQRKETITRLLLQLPNLLHESVPQGRDEMQNVELRRWGEIPHKAFPLKGHEELAVSLNILDMERAARLAGARFYLLKNEGALLDLALQRFAADLLLGRGFSLTLPPFLMRRQPYEGVVDLGDFEDVMYQVEGEDLILIATSEHPLVAQFQGETLDEGRLPLKLAGISPCFRKEAGSHGKDTKGIFRVHQFHKVEQVVLCRPEESWHWHEQLLKTAEAIVQRLELPYRVVNVCTGDIGSIAAKKYDLEVWMPVQQRYRELGSCSNCTDYQARRLRIRYGAPSAPAAGLVHTLNSTALPTTRTIAAILENNQQKDGSVTIPQALRPYLGGMKKIG